MKKSFRGKYDWLEVLVSLHNHELKSLFYCYWYKYGHGKSLRKSEKKLSYNRCAYYALKTYYSTTTIADLVEKLGL